MLIDPPYDFNPAEMLPSDFGSFFLEEFPVGPQHEGRCWRTAPSKPP